MQQDLQTILGRIHNLYFQGDEAKELEHTLNEIRVWLLQHAPKEDRWQWTPESIISNLDFYFWQINRYSQIATFTERRREFPLLKASIEMQLKEIIRYLA